MQAVIITLYTMNLHTVAQIGGTLPNQGDYSARIACVGLFLEENLQKTASQRPGILQDNWIGHMGSRVRLVSAGNLRPVQPVHADRAEKPIKGIDP